MVAAVGISFGGHQLDEGKWTGAAAVPVAHAIATIEAAARQGCKDAVAAATETHPEDLPELECTDAVM